MVFTARRSFRFLGILALPSIFSFVNSIFAFQTTKSWQQFRRHKLLCQYATSTASSSFSGVSNSNNLQKLRVSIVGGGPSGLLVAHRLLKEGATVNLYERRPRPGNISLESRAYALGVGIRGRTAIQSVDLDLWKYIQERGYASERFILHIGPFSIRLRDECDGKANVDAAGNGVAQVEPSLLLYQSDLCGALADALETRWNGSGRLRMLFDCGVSTLNLQKKTITTDDNDKTTEQFDVVVGCDGVNSIVRKQIAEDWPEFQSTQELLPGVFKVVQLPSIPPLLDPTAVQLLFPKSGSVTAFVEPTANGRCCVLFAGSNTTDILFSTDERNITALADELGMRYPKLIGADLESAAQQLISQGKATQASVVTCNTYHYGSVAALVGDAAHATGGVSGQGVNSALQDAAALVNNLVHMYDYKNKEESLRSALLCYSQFALPEGKALYDLSFGPKPTTALGKLRFAAKSARDVLFKGKWGIGELPLQTMLTTSLKTFADIRRDRNVYYDTTFPSQAYWNQSLVELDSKLKTLVI
jgi:kynurenine 3-monooxygenase